MRIQFLIACWILWAVPSAMAQVAVIAHKEVPAEDISKERLLDFYSGESRWWTSDIPVIVFDFGEKGVTRDTFYKYLGRTSSRMKSIWLRRKLSGEGDPPASIEEEESLIASVMETPGAIGFVSQEAVQGNPDVKVLALIALDN